MKASTGLLGDAVLDATRGLATIKMRFPRRGFAGFFVFMSLMGVFFTFGSMMTSRDAHPDPEAQRFFLGLGLAMLLGCTIPSLYLLTRWRRVRIERSEVILDRGWCLGSSSRRYGLSEFQGLRRYQMEMGAMDAATAVASMVGTLAGVHFGKTILFHFLELVHIHDRSLNVVLTGSEDPYAVSEIADALALTFRLPLLIRTADGYAEQTGLAPAPCTNKGAEGLIRPAVTVARPQLATDVGWRAINAGPVSTAVAPPCGLRVETEGTTTRIVFPYSKAALVVGAAVAAIAGAAGVAITIFASGDERWAGLVLPLAALALLLMGVKSRRHKNLVLSSAGLRYDIAAMGVAPVTVPWTDVRDLSVARTAGSQPGLLIVSSGPEIWIGVGMRIEDLQWLEGVIRSFAADPPE